MLFGAAAMPQLVRAILTAPALVQTAAVRIIDSSERLIMDWEMEYGYVHSMDVGSDRS